ncbi:Uncharacterised protein [Burkholderia pseudomallei]|nr:Uncharacterised protein [Burkholderia pseudomallei]
MPATSNSVSVGVLMRGNTLRSASTSRFTSAASDVPRSAPAAGLRNVTCVMVCPSRSIGVSSVCVFSSGAAWPVVSM